MSKYKLTAAQRRKAKKSAPLELSSLIDADEKILWQGKPKKSAFFLNRLFGAFFPFLFAMGFFAVFFIVSGIGVSFLSLFAENKPTLSEALPVILFAVVPLLIFLFIFFVLVIWPIISTAGVWKHTEYAVTDKRIIINSGFISLSYKSIFYKEISDVQLHRGLVDRLTGVGDISFDLVNGDGISLPSGNGVGTALAMFEIINDFIDIADYKDVYIMLKKVIVDIQTDIEYPNALRPGENPGYNTKYTGLDKK